MHMLHMHAHTEKVRVLINLKQEWSNERLITIPNRQVIANLKEAEHKLMCNLRNNGDYKHNICVAELNEGELLTPRRGSFKLFTSVEYHPCASCFEWFQLLKKLSKHELTCC